MENSKNSALKFIVLLGLVSLCADITYEGARSITGPFLATLGASAVAVGFVAGFGELIGYGLRLFSGYVTDKTKKYWFITIIGYAVNLIAVPLLAFVGRWEIAGALIIMERMGKAIRTPARDAMLSYATKKQGRGFGFGLHEAMDQIGALTGPSLMALVLYLKGGYRNGFAILLVPALFAIAILLIARYVYPNPHEFEIPTPALKGKGLKRPFWLYLAAISLVAAGYADFPLIAYHCKKMAIASDSFIPLFYTVAMGIDAIAALIFGRLFDRIGMSAMIIAVAISLLFAPMVFFGSLWMVFAGMLAWGIGMGAQESIMRAAVADMVPSEKRASAYGIFNTGYGVFWFLGSVAMGFLYDISIPLLVIFSVGAQFAAIPIFIWTKKSLASVTREPLKNV
ncbi:MAG: MFS transporter [Candidatus Omnitrophica bacterium]|nr:MFS transporter [Candidatus Omnitrophota bacterium]